jgi:hypothetical protein
MSIIKEDPSWVTKYNGFNNGKDASEGVGGKKIPLQIKAMKTLQEIKDEVAWENSYENANDLWERCGPVFKKAFADIVAERYGAHQVNEFKEKLKAELLLMKITDPRSDIGLSRNTTIDTIIKIHL